MLRLKPSTQKIEPLGTAAPIAGSRGMAIGNLKFSYPHWLMWPRTWEFALVFILGVCAVIVVQSAWKLLQPPTPILQASPSIDLNQADSATLQQLSGIGPHLAARIVHHREVNGPFSQMEDLKQVHGIGPATLERLRVVATVVSEKARSASNSNTASTAEKYLPKPPASKVVDLNLATREDLMTLPGIGPSLADRILEDRQSKGSFQTVEDLMRIRGIKEKTLQKLKPFLKVTKSTKGAWKGIMPIVNKGLVCQNS